MAYRCLLCYDYFLDERDIINHMVNCHYSDLIEILRFEQCLEEIEDEEEEEED